MTTLTDVQGPVTPAERIEAMDVLRGFALLGILLMNIEGMVAPLATAMNGVDPALTGANRVVDAAIYLLVQGKFYPLFSMLFGMGFAVMLTRAQEAGRPFFGTYLRRVLVLLLFGLVHALLIWAGDVLVSYALCGFLLLLFFRRTPVQRLFKWGVAFMSLALALLLVAGVFGSVAQMVPESKAELDKMLSEQALSMTETVAAQRLAYGSGGFAEATAQRVDDTVTMVGMLPVFGFFVLGLFLLGAWFVRSGKMANPHEHERTFSRMRRVALPLGLAMVLVSWWLEPAWAFDRMDLRMSFAQILQMLGGLLMALGYMAWVVRALQGTTSPGWLHWMAPAGRMALTNYLLQSLVMTTIFYAYGLGYFEQLPRAWQPVLVVAFFALQVLFSRWWMQRFRFGPLEWLWRWATYGRRPPMRVA